MFCLALLSRRWGLAIVAAGLEAWAVMDYAVAPILGRRLWRDRAVGTQVAARS